MNESTTNPNADEQRLQQASASTAFVPNHTHGQADGGNIVLANIQGNFPMVTGVPNWIPTGSVAKTIALNSATGEIYYYDYTNKTWKSVGAVTSIAPRVDSITTAASYTLDTDTYDSLTITALDTTLNTLNTSGSPVDFQKLVIRIKDNDTSQTINWGTNFVSQGITLPTATVAGKTMTLGFIYNFADSLWGAVSYVVG